MNLKWLLFKTYHWMGLIGGATVVILSWQLNWPGQTVVAGIAAVLGFFHFVQQQSLEETRLFKDLFRDFNKRYDILNNKLAKIAVDPNLEDEVLRAKFIDYFNLCAEEFLFYKKGYIYQEVWRSWCRGILQYLRVKAVRALWDAEARTGSYYGLTTKEIEDGAR